MQIKHVVVAGQTLRIIATSHPRSFSSSRTQLQIPIRVARTFHVSQDQASDRSFVNALARFSRGKAPEKYWTSVDPRLFVSKRCCGRLFTVVSPPKQYSVCRRSSTLASAIVDEEQRNQYLDLVDHYLEEPDEEQSPSSHEQDAWRPGEESYTVKPAEDEKSSGYKSLKSDAIKTIMDDNASIEDVVKSYQSLPRPGVRYLSWNCRQRLLHRMSTVENKTEGLTLKFLSVLDDMQTAGFPVARWAWTSAVHLAGRTISLIGEKEVEDTLNVWKRMEQDADVKGNTVTFNVLLNVAVKAGQFRLAEMILEEMNRRNLSPTRFTRLGLIFYHGLRRDGNAVRRAYREFVEAGEIVDTVVLNCVIASLLRAGEPVAAEQIYERMKEMHAKTDGGRVPALDYKGRRTLRATLLRAAEQHRGNQDELNRIQSEQSLAPDVKTYTILIQHHATHTGDLKFIVQLIEEMQGYEVSLNGRIFLELFRGFAGHGGVSYTHWTAERLRSVWETFLKLIEEGVEDVYISRWIAIWILRAFAKCEGPDSCVLIRDELTTRWNPSPEEEQVLLDIPGKELRFRERFSYYQK